MNKESKKQIEEIIDKLYKAQYCIMKVQEKEEEKLEKYTPLLSKTKQYQKSKESISFLNDAYLTIDEVCGFLNEAIDGE